jgi:hypothetical protein
MLFARYGSLVGPRIYQIPRPAGPGSRRAQVVDESVDVGAPDPREEDLRLPEKSRDSRPADRIIDDRPGRLRGLLAHGAQQGEHPQVGLGEAEGLGVV